MFCNVRNGPIHMPIDIPSSVEVPNPHNTQVFQAILIAQVVVCMIEASNAPISMKLYSEMLD